MTLNTGMIDDETFQLAKYEFLAKVNAQEPGNRAFENFSTGVVGTQEGYKRTVRTAALDQLDRASWTQDMIGTGEILRQIISSVEVPNNNLIMIEARNGPGTEGHIKLKQAVGSEIKRLETLAYRLFVQDGQSHEQLFDDWVNALGSVYPVVSFLFF